MRKIFITIIQTIVRIGLSGYLIVMSHIQVNSWALTVILILTLFHVEIETICVKMRHKNFIALKDLVESLIRLTTGKAKNGEA